MTVEELDERISSAEFSQWIAYANVEPFGYPMDNYRMGVPFASILNTMRAQYLKRPKQIKPSDFYPKQAKAEPELTPEQRAHIRKKQAKRAKK